VISVEARMNAGGRTACGRNGRCQWKHLPRQPCNSPTSRLQLVITNKTNHMMYAYGRVCVIAASDSFKFVNPLLHSRGIIRSRSIVCALTKSIVEFVVSRFFTRLFQTTDIPGEPKKIPPTTFVDITAMHGNFCTKFYTIVKRSNIHFITKFY